MIFTKEYLKLKEAVVISHDKYKTVNNLIIDQNDGVEYLSYTLRVIEYNARSNNDRVLFIYPDVMFGMREVEGSFDGALSRLHHINKWIPLDMYKGTISTTNKLLYTNNNHTSFEYSIVDISVEVNGGVHLILNKIDSIVMFMISFDEIKNDEWKIFNMDYHLDSLKPQIFDSLSF